MADLVQIGFVAETRGIDTATGKMTKLAKAGDKADKSLTATTKTTNLLGKALAAIGISVAARGLVGYADSWKNINSQLRQVTKSEKELIKTRTRLIELAKHTRQDLGDTVKLYANLKRATAELNLSNAELVQRVETINNLFLAGGASAQEAAGGIRQLGQAFASGVLRGDEFNSIAENAPRIMDALTVKLKMTRGELRAFAATGGITAKILSDALGDYSEEAQKMADATEQTFGQSMENASTNITEFVGGTNSLTSAISAVGGGIVWLSEHIDALVTTAGIAATVFGVHMVRSLAVSAIAANAAAFSVTGLGIAARVAAVGVSTLNSALLLVGGPIGAAVLAAGAITYLAVQSGDAADRIERLRAASEAAAGGMAEMSEASRLLKFDAVSDELEEVTREYEGLVALLKNTEGLSDNSIARVTEDAKLLKGDMERLIDLQKQYSDTATEVAGVVGQYVLLRGEFDRLESVQKQLGNTAKQTAGIYDEWAVSLTSLGVVTGEVNNNLSEMLAQPFSIFVEQIETVEKQSKAYEKLAFEQQKTIDLFVMEGEVLTSASLAYDILHGKIEGLTVAEGESLIARQLAIETLESQAVAAKKAAAQLLIIRDIMNDSSLDYDIEGDPFGELEESADDFGDTIGDLTSSVDDFGGAWTRTGSVIVDAVGGMVDVLDDYSVRLQEITALEQQAAIAREEAQGDPNKLRAIAKQEIRLTKEKTKASIHGLSQVAGAAGEMFEEHSKGRKAMMAAEKVFTAIEIALSLERAAAFALAAIAGAFSSGPFVGFVAGAAMIAIMASLGVFGGGGGGDSGPSPEDLQKNATTGTVMGDPSGVSESIANSSERFEDIQFDQLAELQGIRSAMIGLSSGIQNLAVSLVTSSSFGGKDVGDLSTTRPKLGGQLNEMSEMIDPVGAALFGSTISGGIIKSIFGSTKRRIKDSGIIFNDQGLGDLMAGELMDAVYFTTIKTTKKKLFKKKSKTRDEFSAVEEPILDEFAGIFTHISDAIGGSLESLGVDATNSIDSFVVRLGKLSFEGLSGGEIQEQLEGIFSKQGDLIAEHVLPSLALYQKMGEGAFETITRLAKDQAVFNDALDNMGASLGDLTGMMAVDVAQSVITMMGGLDEFSNATSSYFNNFFSDSEKFEVLQRSMSDAFDVVGVSLPEARDGFKDLVTALDLTTDSGQRAFSTLMAIAPAAADYYDELERRSDKQHGMELQLMEMLGQSAEVLAIKRADELEAMDATLRPLQEQINLQKDLAALAAIENKRGRMELTLMGLLGLSSAVLASKRADELSAMDESLRPLQEQINLQKDLATAFGEASKSMREQNQVLKATLDTATNALKDSFGAERDRMSKLNEIAKTAIDKRVQAELNAINKAKAEKVAAVSEENRLELDAIKDRSQLARKMGTDLRALEKNLLDAVTQLSGGMSIQTAELRVASALASAKAGNFNQALNLGESVSTLSGMKAGDFGSAQEFELSKARSAFSLSELAGVTGGGASAQERMAEGLDMMLVSTAKQHQEAVAVAVTASDKAEAAIVARGEFQKSALDDQLTMLDMQLSSLLGIGDDILSIGSATRQYNEAQLAFNDFDFDTQIKNLNEQYAQSQTLAAINNNLISANQPLRDMQQEINGKMADWYENTVAANEKADAALSSIAKHTSNTAQLLQRQEFSAEA